MKIIFLGLLFNHARIQEAYENSKIGLQTAVDKFQWSLLEGLFQQENVETRILNLPPVGCYPQNYRKLFLHTQKWGEHNCEIGFLNLPICKQIIQTAGLKKELRKQIEENFEEKVCLVAYSIYQPLVSAMAWAKKKYGNQVTACLIQPDAVPGRNGMKKQWYYKKLGNYLIRKTRSIDAFVLFTNYLAETLEVGERPYIILEAIAGESHETSNQKEMLRQEIPVFLYSGTLNKNFSICDMVDAFIKLEEKGEKAILWICGKGDAEEYIQSVSREHSQIQYFGFIKQEEVAKLRRQSSFLINPRRPSGTYTKYSFPSKTIEYMQSGRPTVMYKLEGIPDSYDPYLMYLTAETSDAMADELREILAIPYDRLKQQAEQARKFVCEEKKASVQAGRVVNLLQDLEN